MARPSPAAVVFVADVARVARFYASVFDMAPVESSDAHVVLERDGFQLTLHVLHGEPMPSGVAREDTYLKLCFPVDDIAATRARAAGHGGEVWPADREWVAQARGFRACDGRDPEGNVFQVRAPLS